MNRFRSLLILACLTAAAQQPASLRGTVVNAQTGEPLAKVQVHVLKREPESALTTAYGAVTDDSGRFSVSPIQPGTYYLRPDRPGLLLSKTVPTLEIKTGQQINDFRLEMLPRAIISGRVTNDDGDPLPDITIRAESASGNDLLLSFLAAGVGTTDDRGAYRISVPAGKYRVRAETHEFPTDEADEIRTDGTAPISLTTTWHPQAKTAPTAGIVDAFAGRESTGTDIRVGAVSLSISGIVTGMPTGVKATVNFNVMVHNGNTIYDIETAPDGTFHCSKLEPGIYYLVAQTSQMRSATQELVLSDGSVANLELALHPLAALTGKLDGANPVGLQVALDPAQGDDRPAPAEVKPDGAFEIPAVAPGRYQVNVTSLPADLYVKAVRLNNEVIPRGRIDLQKGASGSQLKISLSPNAAQITGTIQGKPTLGWDNTRVLLLPAGGDPFEGWEDHEFGIAPNSEGAFHLDSVPPGRYRLCAIDFVSPTAPQTRPALAKALEHVEIFEIRESDRLTRTLKPLTAEPSDVH